MEFFDNTITYLCVGIIYSVLAFILGYNVAKKKFQVEHETPKVSTNKEAKEGCCRCGVLNLVLIDGVCKKCRII